MYGREAENFEESRLEEVVQLGDVAVANLEDLQ
jgi:hypothetical protein